MHMALRISRITRNVFCSNYSVYNQQELVYFLLHADQTKNFCLNQWWLRIRLHTPCVFNKLWEVYSLMIYRKCYASMIEVVAFLSEGSLCCDHAGRYHICNEQRGICGSSVSRSGTGACLMHWFSGINTLRPRQNGRHFADDIFK